MTPARVRRPVSRPVKRHRQAFSFSPERTPSQQALPNFEVVRPDRRLLDVGVAWENMSVEEASSLGLEVGRHVRVFNNYGSLVSVGYGVDRHARWLTWLSDVPQNLVYVTLSQRRSLAEDLATAVVVDLALGYQNAEAASRSGLVLLNALVGS